MRVTMGLLGILAFLALTSAQDNHSKQKRGHPGPKMVPVPVPIPVPVHHHHHHPVVMPAGSNNYQEWTGPSAQLFPEAQMIQESQDNGFFDPRGLRDFHEMHQPMAYPRYAFQPGYDGGRPRKNYYSATAGHSSERSGDNHYAPGGEPRGHRRRVRPSRPEMESQVPGPMKPAESFQENNEW